MDKINKVTNLDKDNRLQKSLTKLT